MLVTPEELEDVRRYIQMRDQCAMRLGVAWLEFDALKISIERRVEKLLAEEQTAVNELARRHGLEGVRFRVNLDTGQIERVG